MPAEPQPVTILLQQLSAGDEQALNALMPMVYEQLRRQASRCLAGERGSHTLPATALVHEAYLRLVKSEISWQNRAHFYALAARLMRRILVDHARTKKREKRGGSVTRVPLEEVLMVGISPPMAFSNSTTRCTGSRNVMSAKAESSRWCSSAA